MSKRPSYSREFKLEAVRLLKSGEKPAADLARELGVNSPIGTCQMTALIASNSTASSTGYKAKPILLAVWT